MDYVFEFFRFDPKTDGSSKDETLTMEEIYKKLDKANQIVEYPGPEADVVTSNRANSDYAVAKAKNAKAKENLVAVG